MKRVRKQQAADTTDAARNDSEDKKLQIQNEPESNNTRSKRAHNDRNNNVQHQSPEKYKRPISDEQITKDPRWRGRRITTHNTMWDLVDED